MEHKEFSLKQVTTQIEPFLDRLLDLLEKENIPVSNMTIDHVCRRVETIDEYRTICAELKQQWAKEIGKPATIGGREITTRKLPTSVLYKHENLSIQQTIQILELPAPKPNTTYKNGLQHAEFVVPEWLEHLIESTPKTIRDLSGFGKTRNRDIALNRKNGSIEAKFHEKALEDVITEEQNI